MKFKWIAIQSVILCIVVFILQYLFPITESLALISADILLRPWMIITHIFLHGGIDHLIGNMIALALFGSILEKIIGWKRFLKLFFISGIIAAIGAAVFYPATIGASGAVMGILGALSILRPKMLVFVGGIPMPMIAAAGFWAVLDLIGFFDPLGFGGGIANAAHLFGLFFGIGVGIYFRKKFGERKPKLVDELKDKDLIKWENEWMK